MSAGLRIMKGELNSTMLRAFWGALWISVITALSGSRGSTSKYALPFSRAYAPTVPNSWPPANGTFSVITSLVTCASAGSEEHATAIAIRGRHVNPPTRDTQPLSPCTASDFASLPFHIVTSILPSVFLPICVDISISLRKRAENTCRQLLPLLSLGKDLSFPARSGPVDLDVMFVTEKHLVGFLQPSRCAAPPRTASSPPSVPVCRIIWENRPEARRRAASVYRKTPMSGGYGRRLTLAVF